MNNKGFTFIEILAVIVLIGILSSIAIIGVSRYRENAKNKDYEALAKSSYNAMEEYMMKHPYKKKVSLETLENGSFLSNRKDPGTKTTDCTGSVEVEKEENGSNGTMDKNKYTVYLCCTNYKKIYTYPEGNVEDYTGTDKCDIDESSTEPDPIPTPSQITTQVTFNCNGGTGGGTQTFKSNVIGQKFSKTCTRTGYTQDGWKKDKNGSSRDYTTNNGVSDTWIISNSPKTTLYAHWNIKTFKCNAGYYLKKSGTSCTKCPANYYCPGGTFKYNKSNDQGINKCSEKASGYSYSNAGSSSINNCYIKVSKNYYIKKAKSKTTTKCASGTYKDAHNVNYGKISSCTSKSTTVSFNCNGGSGGGTQTFKSNVAGQKFSKTCTRTGYTLVGWKKSKTATARDYTVSSNVTENFVLTTSPSITLYAHWEPKCVQIKLFKNDGTNSSVGPYSYCIGSTLNQLGYTSTGTFRYANKYQFGNWNHQKKGNSILGWSTNKNATTASYANPNNNERAYWKVPDSFIIANSGKTINFYAIYHTTRAYIHYSANGGKFNTTYMPPGLVHDDGVPYWKTGMFRYWVGRTVTIDGVSYNQVAHIRYADESTFTILRDEMLYGDTAYFHGSGLTDYNWEYYMYITNSSANAAPYDKEWKCISSNCRGKLYSENKSNYVSTDFCDGAYTDCSVVLGVNWQ